MTEEQYDSKECKKLPDDENPLQPINDLHNMIKKFLDSHSGFDHRHLQDYLNLFAFIYNDTGYPLEKVYELIEMGLTKPIRLQY